MIIEWMRRIGAENYFHGVDGPDRADFQMFSVLEKRLGYTWVKRVIDRNQEADPFYSWFYRMRTVINSPII